MSSMRVLVVGIGQTLRGDDAAGVEAVRLWQQAFKETATRSDVTIQFSELPGLSLLDMLNGFDGAVLVDAVQSSALPGHIHRLGLEDLASFGMDSRSAHGWGVAESLQLGRKLDPSIADMRIRLIGIEAQLVELGQPMSDAVRKALPDAAQAIEEEIRSFPR
jgi:hydrogenase maturation protease